MGTKNETDPQREMGNGLWQMKIWEGIETMTWTMFITILVATIVGDAVWCFAQLWLLNTTWCQNIAMRVSLKIAKKAMDEFEDEEV